MGFMIKAIYRKRKDGNYDFVAAFAGHHADPLIEKTIVHLSGVKRKELIRKDFKDVEHLTDVIEGWEVNFEKKFGTHKLTPTKTRLIS
tara:strand:+ start:366 stop:629 length:264 start_codon:yes stop_codon:yes gene_type:complete